MASDVIIIGAGVIGLSCAWRLAQAGAKVTVFDRGAAGSGATGASLGALWPASPLAKGPLQQLHRQSLSEFETFLRELKADSNRPVSYFRRGRLEILTEPRQRANAEAEAAAACTEWAAPTEGEDVMEVLSPDDARLLEPGTLTGDVAVVLDRSSAQVRVPELMAALASACAAANVTLVEGTAVERVVVEAGKVQGVQTASQTVAADTVLVTAGAWTTQLLPSAPIRPVRGQGLMLRIDHPAISRLIKRGAVYLVPWPQADGSHLVLVGSTTEAESGFDTSNTLVGVRGLMDGALAIVPALAGARVEKIWAGLRPDAPRHQPIMGLVTDVTGLFMAAGHYKTGIGMAPIVSRLLAAFITTGRPPSELEPFALK